MILYLILPFLFTCSICIILFNKCVQLCLINFFERPYGRNAYKGEERGGDGGRGGLKIGPKIRTYLMHSPKQMLWNILYFLFNGMAKYTKASPPARKISLLSSIIIIIILSYAIIRIYINLYIYLQVSKTEGLAELHCLIGQSALEKISSICFHRISLVFSRMFF